MMAHPYHHAKSSVKKWGGVINDYLPIHDWFDATKAFFPDARHRALRHHSYGVFMCQHEFGHVITNADGKEIPVRLIGEQHLLEDFGRIPTVNDWLNEMPVKSWMLKAAKLSEQ